MERRGEASARGAAHFFGESGNFARSGGVEEQKAMLLGILTCKENLARLDDYVDRELSPLDLKLVERHLKICHECARKFAFERSLQEGLRQKITHLDVPENLLSNIKTLLAAAPVSPADAEAEASQDGAAA